MANGPERYLTLRTNYVILNIGGKNAQNQTAKELDFTERTIRKKLRNDTLEGEKRSQAWAVPKEVVENYDQ